MKQIKCFEHITIFKFFITLILTTYSLFLASCNQFQKSEENAKIVVIVEDRLMLHIQESIRQFESDLKEEGFSTILLTDISKYTTPLAIKKKLQEEFKKDKKLAGAVLIGKIPSALYNEKIKQGDPYWHDHLCDFYYMDLDGTWEDSDSNGVLDSHRSFSFKIIDKVVKRVNRISKIFRDRRAPEIWVSRIRADTLTSIGNEVELLKSYFSKNHAYRSGKMSRPPARAFVVAPGLDVLKSDWGARPELIYEDVAIFQCQNGSSNNLKILLNSEYGYEFGIINVFSGPRIHHFDYFESDGFDSSWWNTIEGRALITQYSEQNHKPYDISTVDIKMFAPKTLFYHLLTSEVGRHDVTDYLAGAYIFTGSGLTAIAGTQHSGAIGGLVLYENLSTGMAIGEAWKNALQWSIEQSGKKMNIYWCDGRNDTWEEGTDAYKAVLIGDGTLKLNKKP